MKGQHHRVNGLHM